MPGPLPKYTIILTGDQEKELEPKHKIIVPTEAIGKKWQGSCKTGKKKTHPVE